MSFAPMDSDTLPPPTPHFSPAARPPRQPTRTRLTGLILIVFMLMVWFVGPAPSAAARRAATLILPENPPFSRALAAIAAGQFDEAFLLLDGIEKKPAKDRTPLETVRAARAQAEVYSGQFAAASSHYAELL